MPRFQYRKSKRNDDLLHQELLALALPGFRGVCSSEAEPDLVELVFADDSPLPAGVEALASAAVLRHTYAPRKPRSPQAVCADIEGLPKAQRERLLEAAVAHGLASAQLSVWAPAYASAARDPHLQERQQMICAVRLLLEDPGFARGLTPPIMVDGDEAVG